MLTENKINSVAVYCRLSVDDGNKLKESNSIANQKEIILKYVKQKGWQVYKYYIDDGFSGTNFNRPGFLNMLQDIEKELVNVVITKDLSRLGRDYLKTGFYIDNYFKDHNIRYIALSDGVDTFEREDEFLAFKNIFNEMYAKDISKKIKFTLNNQMQNGKDIKTSIPLFGYQYAENNKRIKDPFSSLIVKRIFFLYLNNNSYKEICSILNAEKIKTPLLYAYEKYNYGKNKLVKNKISTWKVNMVKRILKNEEYLGTFIRRKSISMFKGKRKYTKNKGEQYVFENKYEALIDSEIFLAVQEKMQNNLNTKIKHTNNIYQGLLFCPKCHKKLYLKIDKRTNTFLLKTKKKCCSTCGSIRYEILNNMISKELLTLKKVILKHEKEFRLQIKNNLHVEENPLSIENEQLKTYNSALKAVNNYIKQCFEQYENKFLDENAYLWLIKTYSLEKNELEEKIKDINRVILKLENKNIFTDFNFSFFKKLTKKNILEKLNISQIISRIYLQKTKKNKYQIDIVYKKLDPFLNEFIAYGK